MNEDKLIGRNAVAEGLKSGRIIDKILIKQGEREGSIKKILADAKEQKIIVQEVSKQKLDEIASNHQGVIALCATHDYVEVEDILAVSQKRGEDPFIVILDNIKDPHNLGAIMRTAECAGVHGIIIPKRRSVGLTSVVSKTSAGAIEYMPVARVTNISSTIDMLKKQNIWVVSADLGGKEYFKQDLKGGIAVVIGSEGEGVGRLISEKCDFTVSIPMAGKITSLNASVAAGLIMYEVVRQRIG